MCTLPLHESGSGSVIIAFVVVVAGVTAAADASKVPPLLFRFGQL
jgi:hypothetical protein